MSTLPPVTQAPERRRGTRCCEDLAPPAALGPEAAGRFAADLLVLAHPVRLRILEILTRKGGQVCVCDLEAAVPVKQPTISHHLRLLRDAGLVDTLRRGVWAYYHVKPEALESLKARVARGLGAL